MRRWSSIHFSFALRPPPLASRHDVMRGDHTLPASVQTRSSLRENTLVLPAGDTRAIPDLQGTRRGRGLGVNGSASPPVPDHGLGRSGRRQAPRQRPPCSCSPRPLPSTFPPSPATSLHSQHSLARSGCTTYLTNTDFTRSARATVNIASDESHRGSKYDGVKLDGHLLYSAACRRDVRACQLVRYGTTRNGSLRTA